jgi:hypothetical protein
MPRAQLVALRRTALGSCIMDPGAVAAEVSATDAGALLALQRYLRHDDFTWRAVATPAYDAGLLRLKELGPDTATALAAIGLNDLHRFAAALAANSPEDDKKLIALPGITARRLAAWRAQLAPEPPGAPTPPA